MRFERLRYILTPSDIINLKNYQYECDGKGVIQQCVDAVAAKLVAPRMPSWLSPHVISLIGFFIHLVGAIAVITNDKSSFAGELPVRVSVLYMTCLFVYGVLDSVDGVQARKLGCENALSDMFDHGLDAVTMGFMLLSVSCLLRYGYFITQMFCLCMGGSLLFFLTHWRALTFGPIKYSKIDVVEGHYFVQCLFLFNVVFGSGMFWSEFRTPAIIEGIIGRPVEVADVLFVVVVAFGSVRCLLQLQEICVTNGRSTYAGLRTLSPVSWLVSVSVLAYLNYSVVSYFIFDFTPQFFCITVLFPMAKLSWAAIIAHMARCDVPSLDTCLLPSLVLLVWLLFARWGISVPFAIRQASSVFNSLFVISILDLIYFAGSNAYITSRGIGYPLFTVRQQDMPM